jgi:serine/threonine protein phosphatase PrpC
MSEITFAGLSDTGRVRPVNQDRFYVENNLMVVADGMGGHVAGEIAAQMAVDEFKDKEISGAKDLAAAVKRANLAIWNKGLDDLDLRGMGTTVTVAYIRDSGEKKSLNVVHVGDSRAYLLRNKKLFQLTEDHTLVEELIRRGQIKASAAQYDKRRHTLTRALGIEPDVVVDAANIDLEPGDKILLCSDGLSNELSEAEMIKTLESSSDPKQIVGKLISQARARGGHDNITAVVAAFASKEKPAEKDLEVPKAVVKKISSKRKKALVYDTEDTKVKIKSPPAVNLKVVLFFMLLIAMAISIAVLVNWYVKNTYYVGINNDKVAIYKGRPQGQLWFSPKLVYQSNLDVDKILPSEVSALQSGILEPSYDSAKNVLTNLYKESNSIKLAGGSPTPSS